MPGYARRYTAIYSTRIAALRYIRGRTGNSVCLSSRAVDSSRVDTSDKTATHRGNTVRSLAATYTSYIRAICKFCRCALITAGHTACV